MRHLSRTDKPDKYPTQWMTSNSAENHEDPDFDLSGIKENNGQYHLLH